MTEKTNNKQKNKKIVLALVWYLPARRLFGGVLGICDFRHETPKQSQTSLTPAMRDRLGSKDQVFQGKKIGFLKLWQRKNLKI